MRVFLSPYEMQPLRGGGPRRGYLMKLLDADGCAGFSDIFPWVEFGDPSFDEIPELLRREMKIGLLGKSFTFAKKDLSARRNNISFFNGQELRNHYLLTSVGKDSWSEVMEAFSDGYCKIKIKVCRSGPFEKSFFDRIPEGIPDHSLRLDANARLSLEDLECILNFKDKIDYIEDPFARPEDWGGESNLFAFDQPGFRRDQVDCPWQIFKPARQKVDQIQAERVVFSSYLDHPVGIAHAFVEALSWGEQREIYGLASQNSYKKTCFHEYLNMRNDLMSVASSGLGIGFSDELDRLNWKELGDFL